MDGRAIQPGAVLGLIDDRIEVVGSDLERAVVETLEHLGAGHSEVITLYAGADVSPEAGQTMRRRVGQAFPSQQVDLVSGGQPLYPYLLACE
jgi:dihydroxyacetone kinase-like predicted kinase